MVAADFGVLGPLVARRDGRPVDIDSAQQRRLLAALLVDAGRVVSTDRLIAALWRDRPPATALRTLRTYVFRLRELLGRDVVLTRTPGYRLQVTPGQVDAARFEAILDQAGAMLPVRPARSAALLDEALALWRGPAYGEFADEEFVRPEALRLEETRLRCREERFEAGLAAGGHSDLVAELEAFVAANPLRERARGQLMLALYRCGRQADALATYRSGRDMLAEQLGLEPGPQLQARERDILRQRPELNWRTPGDGPGNLTQGDQTSFVGREDDVAAVVAALAETGVVTLTGPGGVGKTRLARRVAAADGDRYPDGVWWCELAAVSDSHAVASAVATALGVAITGGGSIEAALVKSLRPKRFLLLLDNCEHVCEGAGALAAAISRGAPGATVMTTSRIRLGIAGERTIPVAPLPAPAAVTLFVERARSNRPNLELSGQDLDMIADVCARLDGLPLAVELAAARLRSMNAGDLAGRLADRFRLLNTGPRDVDPRHRSLRSVVEWSYALLDETERRVFQRLCVFAGPFTLDAAERICAADGVAAEEVPDLLTSLVDASMVLVGPSDGPVRYSLLETLRQFGLESLAGRAGLVPVQRRHAEYYTGLAEDAATALRGRHEARAGATLDADLANLRAAHLWAREHVDVDLAVRMTAALFRFALWRLHDEVFRWAESTVDLPGAAGHPLYPVVCGMAGWGCGLRCQRAAAVAYAEMAQAVTHPDDPACLASLEALGHVALWEGRLAQARDYFERATRLADDPVELLPVEAHALALAYDGRVDEALGVAEAGRRRADRLGNPSMQAILRYGQGEALMSRDPIAAAALFEDATRLAGPVQNRLVLGVAGVSATSLRARHGEPAEALTSFRETIDLWRSGADWTHLWTGLRSLVDLLHHLGADEPAAVLLGAVAAADTAAPPYGEDAERLSRLSRSLADRLGTRAYTVALERGHAMTDEHAVQYALTEIGHARSRIETLDH